MNDGEAAENDLRELWLIPSEYEVGGMRWFRDAAHNMAAAVHPLLGEVPLVELPEGPEVYPKDVPRPPEASSLYRTIAAQHEWNISLQDVADFNLDQFLVDLYALGDSMGGQIERGMVEHISDVSDEFGRTVDASGRDFVDALADSLETMEMTFDENGRPNLTIVMNPADEEKLRRNPPTPQQEARIQAILERKRSESIDSRRRRDLP